MAKVGVRSELCLLLAVGGGVWLSGCGGTESAESPVNLSRTAESHAPQKLVDRCQWTERKAVPGSRIRATFASGGPGDVHLLLSDSVVRPGGILSVAIGNDSTQTVGYGTTSHVETSDGKEVRIDGPYGFRSILLLAEAQEVGPCVSLPVPSDTRPGNYTAVLEDVDLELSQGDRAVARDQLRAGFKVDGAPIENPLWETRLRNAAKSDGRD